LGLSIQIPGEEEHRDKWIIENAIVPLYPKIRTSVTELINALTAVMPAIMDYAVPEENRNLCIEVRFLKSGNYLTDLRRREPINLFAFMRRISLPRYLGLVRVQFEGHPLCDFVFDSTDTYRTRRFQRSEGCGPPDGESERDYGGIRDTPLIASVCYRAESQAFFDMLSKELQILANSESDAADGFSGGT
jgi:hypothetical protein